MFRAVLKLLAFSNQPTGRTLRLLSCPPRLLIPSAGFPRFRIFMAFEGWQQNAIPIIPTAARLMDGQTGRPPAVPVSRSRPSTDRSTGTSAAHELQTDRQRTRRVRVQ